jgi:hypothetical protein
MPGIGRIKLESVDSCSPGETIVQLEPCNLHDSSDVNMW